MSELPLKGPFFYENWLAWQRGDRPCGAIETGLFSDAHVTGQLENGYGPYKFINHLALPELVPDVRPAIILRVELHIDENSTAPLPWTPDDSRFHGGTFSDEAAALLSLSLGLRLKAGPVTREFEPGADPRGQPLGYDSRCQPVPPSTSSGKRLPGKTGTHLLDSDVSLKTLPNLDAKAAIAIVRSARLYQDAIWIADAEPSLSWVMLVSAIEVAAGHWRATQASPIDRLSEAKPALAQLLRAAGGEGLIAKVADQIADTMGSTKKFVDFISEYLPSPPSVRPLGSVAQVCWESAEMRRHLKMIYSYRSRALHAGTPFPLPMTNPPMLGRQDETPEERPLGLMMSSHGAVWKAEDCPMCLHTFEYIVRESLNAWWQTSAGPTSPRIE